MARPWIIFDADNTLWNVERLYDQAREDLVRLIAALGQPAGRVEDYQQKLDHKLFAEFGYLPTRFPTSFVQTLLHFAPEASESEINRVRARAERVFLDKAPLFPGVGEVLEDLSQQFALGLMTAGASEVQERRIDQSGLAHFFKTIRVVPKKTDAEFASFCKDNKIPLRTSWSVGDSLKSDILPARHIGLNALWVRNHNWSRVEVKSHEFSTDIVTVAELRQVPEGIASALARA